MQSYTQTQPLALTACCVSERLVPQEGNNQQHQTVRAQAAGELGVLGNLQTPGVVVDQMPMQHVELVERHEIDVALDESHRLVLAGGIK